MDRDLRIALGDADLLRDIERGLPQVELVSHAIGDRDQDIEPRLEYSRESSQPLDDPGMLLGHDAKASGKNGRTMARRTDPAHCVPLGASIQAGDFLGDTTQNGL